MKKSRPTGAQVLRAIREATGYSQWEMASKMSIRERTYQRLEGGQTRVRFEVLQIAREVALASPGASQVARMDPWTGAA